jgi:hypothetical protein
MMGLRNGKIGRFRPMVDILGGNPVAKVRYLARDEERDTPPKTYGVPDSDCDKGSARDALFFQHQKPH